MKIDNDFKCSFCKFLLMVNKTYLLTYFRKFLQKDRDHNENKAIASFVLSLPFNSINKDDHVLPEILVRRIFKS